MGDVGQREKAERGQIPPAMMISTVFGINSSILAQL